MYFKSHRILSPCLTPFCAPSASDQLSEEFYFIFPLSQPGIYSLLINLLPPFSQNHFLYCRHHIHFSLLYNILILGPPSLNFISCCCYWPCCGFYAILLPLIQCHFNFISSIIVYSPLFLPHCFHHPSVFYLHFKFCSLPFYISIPSLLINSPLSSHSIIFPPF